MATSSAAETKWSTLSGGMANAATMAACDVATAASACAVCATTAASAVESAHAMARKK